MNKEALLIVNPYSGKKQGEKTAAYITAQLAAKSFSCRVFISRSMAELDAFVKDTDLGSLELIGIIGGDGTMHEFLNAALRYNETIPPAIALFPCGTGNSFNLDIGCNSVDETLACIYSGSSMEIDLAEVDYEDRKLWSFNILGCGLVAEINRLAEKMRFLGSSRYSVASVIKLLANPVYDMRIVTDEGELSGRFSFMLACNTRYAGKNMMMAPRAQLTDGKLDLLLVEACSVFTLLKLFPKIFKGEHIGAEVLRYIQTTKLELQTGSKNLVTNIDGEMKGQSPLRLTVHKNKVKVFVK